MDRYKDKSDALHRILFSEKETMSPKDEVVESVRLRRNEIHSSADRQVDRYIDRHTDR